MTVETHKETLDFQTEARQLLNLMIHSLYSNKEIFLRELISNASDACDKLRFEALTDDALYENDGDLKVRIAYDKKSRTVTVADNGIGMTRQEVMDHIGTIAKSGTRQFFESLTGDQSKDTQLIGQFGVGFYSTFIVADKVTLTTRRAGLGAEHGVRWESDGEGSYTLETMEKAGRGTEITLHLRKDDDEFLDGYRLRNIIQKYSDSISLPIVMQAEGGEDKDDKDKQDKEETVNRASALWMRSKKDISAEDYNELYKHIAHDFEDPLSHIHSQVEGRQSYTTLFYIPARAPFDLWDRERRHGVKLYVRRVFIMDDADQLMPNYLRFVRGIVDSDDLPLNVSREILQHNKQIDLIRGASVKKMLGLLEKLAKKDAEKYQKFWGEFGQVMKEGPAEDRSNGEKIAKLLRFSSTHNDNDQQDISLDDYITRMKDGQDAIYYITADSYAAAKNSPHLEVFQKKDIEVILLHDRVDEWMLTGLSEYEGKTLRSVAKGDLDLGDLEDKEEKEAFDKVADDFKALTGKIRENLGDKVKEVRVTHRLTDSPACLVVEEEEMANSLRKILEAAGQSIPVTQPILEINPRHPLLKKIKDEQDETRLADWSGILFDQALLSEGGQLADPALFVKRMNALLMMMAEKSGD